MKDPAPYLARFEPDLRCPVFPERAAVIDPSLRVSVNHESWFVSGPEARRKFLDDPLAWVTMLTDPVDASRFRPDRDSPRIAHLGRPYFFASRSTHDAFASDPSRWAEPRREMPKAP